MNGKEMVEWEEKVWGRVMHIFSSEKAGVSYLEVVKGFQCSRHFHKQRVNAFAVISGKLLILEWLPIESDECNPDRFSSPRQTILSSGQTYSIPTFVDHKFCVLKSGVVVEYYSPEHDWDRVQIDDIIRKDEGGEVPEKILLGY